MKSPKTVFSKVGEPIAPSYHLNVGILNVLWTVASGRRMHAQQQEFQSVYECIEKITQFMSKAAIMSFMPFLARILPENITKMERGRYFRDRFVAISEVIFKITNISSEFFKHPAANMGSVF